MGFITRYCPRARYMRTIVKPERLRITVEMDGRLFSFPGGWASNFRINELGELVRNDSSSKFYVDQNIDSLKTNKGLDGHVLDKEVQAYIGAIQSEAKRIGWQIVWPDGLVL